jgi:hypothetical protein
MARRDIWVFADYRSPVDVFSRRHGMRRSIKMVQTLLQRKKTKPLKIAMQAAQRKTFHLPARSLCITATAGILIVASAAPAFAQMPCGAAPAPSRAEISQLNARLISHAATPAIAASLKSQQQAWTAFVAHSCKSLDGACLQSQLSYRETYLRILNDRIGVFPLNNLQPTVQLGVWSAPGAPQMLSSQDNPQNDIDIPLSPDDETPGKSVDFPADQYRQSGLPLPGATITGSPGGTVRFSGPSFEEHDNGTNLISANACLRPGWIATTIAQFPSAAAWPWPNPTTDNAFPGYKFSPSRIAPATIESDLHLPPTAPAYIGFLPADIPANGTLRTAPIPAELLVAGNDGALYAVLAIPLYDQKGNDAGIATAYQKWEKRSPAAAMQTLPLLRPPPGPH